MKKRDKKLIVHRETLRPLEARELVEPALAKVAGAWKCTGCVSGCGILV